MSILIIAEIGVNHNGDVQLAKEMVAAAKECGADIVKFQTFSADRLAGTSTPKVPYQMRTSDPRESHHAMLKKLELSADAHVEIKKYCDQLNMNFVQRHIVMKMRHLNIWCDPSKLPAPISLIENHEFIAGTERNVFVCGNGHDGGIAATLIYTTAGMRE